MEKRARATIKDVARVANVTPQTVSRALRNAPDVSAAMRERILKIASDLDYVKNNTASSLRQGTSKLICVVYDNLVNVYFSIMTDFIQQSLKERGYSILTLALRSGYLGREGYLSAVAHNADGIISFIEPEEEISSLIKQYRVPVLLFGRRTAVDNIDYIHTDDEEGGRIAARRLSEAGCKNIVCLTETLQLTCAYDRYSGFKEELVRRGHGEPAILDAFPETLEERFLTLCKERGAPDGIFCFNDMLAFEMLYLYEKHGLPPAKIIGYDAVQEQIHIPRRLTSIGTNKKELAEAAAQILISRVENELTPLKAEKRDVYLVEGITA